MRIYRFLAAVAAGLAGAFLLWGAAAAAAPDGAAGAATEGFVYEVLSGILPANDPAATAPDEVTLTEGWHGAYIAGVDSYRALDFVHNDRVTDETTPVYAVIRTVTPTPLLPHPAPQETIVAVVGDDTSPSGDGCRQVEIEFYREGSDRPIGTVVYKHVWSQKRVAGQLVDIVAPDDPIPLSRVAGTIAPPVQLGTISHLPQANRPSDGGDGPEPGCKSSNFHLHQEAPNYSGEDHLHRHIPDPPDTALALRFGFLTVGAGSNPGGTLRSDEYRPFCSDTWLFRIQASTTAPDPSPIATCARPSAPVIQAEVTVENNTIHVSWREPVGAWDNLTTSTPSDGFALTGYAIQYRLTPPAGGVAPPWPATWDAISLDDADLTSGTRDGLPHYTYPVTLPASHTRYQMRVRAVNDRGPGPPSAAVGASTWPAVNVTVSGRGAVQVDQLQLVGGTAGPQGAAGPRGASSVLESIACASGASCELAVPVNATVRITATAEEGFAIAAWSGACAARTASDTFCDVVVDENKTVRVTFTDPSTPTVTITRGASPVTEGTAASFTITRTGATSADLTVHVAVSDGVSDFLDGDPPTEVTIPTGSASAALTVATDDDDTDEADGSVTATLTAAAAYDLGSPSAATVIVQDNDQTITPLVTIAAGTSPVTEGTAATFTVTRTGATTDSLAVTVDVTQNGTFIDGTAPTSVTIDVNAASATLAVATDDDSTDETNGSITATLTDGTAYDLGTPAAATVTVQDNDDAPTTDTAPQFSQSSASYAFTRGTAGSATLPAATGGDGTRSYSLSSTPAGLSFSASTRVLAGTPTTVGTTTHTYTVSDSDSNIAASDRDTMTITVTVGNCTVPAKPADSTSATTTQGTPFWNVGTSAADEQRTDTTVTTVTTYIWNSATCRWQASTSSTTSTATITLQSVPKPADDTRTVEVRRTHHDWVCSSTSAAEREVVTKRHERRPHVWSSTDEKWVDGPTWIPGPEYDDPPSPTGVTQPKPADDTRTVTTTPVYTWRVSGMVAYEQETYTQRDDTRPHVCYSSTPPWRDGPTWILGTPYTVGPADTGVTEPKPPDDMETETLSTTLTWRLSGTTAYEQKTETKRDDRRPHVFHTTAPPWRDGPTWIEGTPYTEGPTDTGRIWEQPPHDTVTRTVTYTDTQWVTVSAGTFCRQYEEERSGTRNSYYHRPHVFHTTAPPWRAGTVVDPFPYHTDPTTTWGAWQRTGESRACPARSDADGARGQTAAPAAQLTAGTYVWHVGAQRFQFEVPAAAVVQLSERTLTSGEAVAVFTAADGTELIVDPATLPAADAPSDGQFSAVVEPTLAALAATLRQAPPRPAASPTTSAAEECPVAAADAQGSVAIDLDVQGCTVVRGDGRVTVSRGDAARTFTLDATLDWLVIDGTDVASSGAAAVTFVTIPNEANPHSGSIHLALSDGTELARQVPPESPALDAVFDAITSAAPGN